MTRDTHVIREEIRNLAGDLESNFSRGAVKTVDERKQAALAAYLLSKLYTELKEAITPYAQERKA